MASPQTENGYTKIANELLEVVACTPLAGREFRVVIFVIRKTYGFHKKEDRIALSQFSQGTGIGRREICRIIAGLVKKNILHKTEGKYTLNKDYQTWLVAFSTTQLVACTPPTKETITKDIIRAKAQSKNMRTYNQNEHFEEDLPSFDMDTGEVTSSKPEKKLRTNPVVKNVFAIFYDNPARSSWLSHPVQREAALILNDTYGLEELKSRYAVIVKHRNEEMCPQIYTPSSMLQKMPAMEHYLKNL